MKLNLLFAFSYRQKVNPIKSEKNHTVVVCVMFYWLNIQGLIVLWSFRRAEHYPYLSIFDKSFEKYKLWLKNFCLITYETK